MYKICELNEKMYPVPQSVVPMRLLEALEYIDEYHEKIRPLVPVRETRFDIVFEKIEWSNLLVDMILYWDEYWDDWEYYDDIHKLQGKVFLDERDILLNV